MSEGGQQPLPITVVVPTRNASRYVERCMRAIRWNRPAELIVVDGNSGDDTVALAEPYADRIVQDGGRGVAAARQLGASLATEPLVAFIDSDVSLLDGSLERMADERERRGLGAIQAALHSVGSGDYWSEQLAAHHNGGRIRHWFGVSACLLDRDLIQMLQFDERFVSGEDVDMRMRLARVGVPLGVSEEVTALHYYPPGFEFAKDQWLADGEGLGRLLRRHGSSGLRAAILPFGSAVLGILRGLGVGIGSWPYYTGHAVGNWIGLLRGLTDRRIALHGPGRRALIGSAMLAAIVAPLVGLAVLAAGIYGVIALAASSYDGSAATAYLTLGLIGTYLLVQILGHRAPERVRLWMAEIAGLTNLLAILAMILLCVRLAGTVGL